MSNTNVVKFTHTTHNTEVLVFADQIVAAFYFEGYKSTTLLGSGGVAIPVIGTVEEAINKLADAKHASLTHTKEAIHGS